MFRSSFTSVSARFLSSSLIAASRLYFFVITSYLSGLAIRRFGLRAVPLIFTLLLPILLSSQVSAALPGVQTGLPDKEVARFDWLDDPDEPLTLQQVINRRQHGTFQTLDGALGRGYTLSNSWLSLRLTAQELEHFDYLWMAPSHLNELDVYYQTGLDAKDEGSYQKLSLGDHADGSEKPYRHFRMIFPLKRIQEYQAYPAFKALGEYQIYIRIRTNSTHALTAELMTDAAMVRESNFYLFFYAGFTAIALVLSAFSLFVAFRLRDRVYMWYALYLLTVMAAYMPITGIFFVVFVSAPAYLSDLFSGAGTGLGFLCFSFLSLHLLEAERAVNPWLAGYLKFTAAAGLLQAMLSPFDGYSYIAGFIGMNAALFSVVLMVSFAGGAIRGSTGDRFIFSALTLTVIGVLINFSRLLGWLPENVFTIHAFQFTSLLHMLLLNQAFAERVMSAEKQALKAAQLSEQRAREMADGMNQELYKVLDQEKATRKEQERFIDMISHEYRTPLSILKTNLEILELKEKPDWTGRHNLHVMLQASERLQEVFDKTIKGSSWRKTASNSEHKIELVSLFDHLMDEAHLMWNSISLSYNVSVGHAWYRALDAAQLKTLVFNLIDNARKYSSDPRAIKVSLGELPDGSGVFFQVGNPVELGCGRLGEELTQKYVRGANSAGTSGLGMGLNLVEQIVSQMEGRIEIESEETYFRIRISLPAEAAPEEDLSDLETEHFYDRR